MSYRIKTFSDVKKGQKFKVTDNSNGHNYPIGKILTFKTDGRGRSTSWTDCVLEGSYNTLDVKDVMLIGETLDYLNQRYVSINEDRDKYNVRQEEELKKYTANVHAEIKRFNKEVDDEMKDIEQKIAFCKSLGITEYDDNVHKMYEAIKIINDKGDISDIEKARIISELLDK